MTLQSYPEASGNYDPHIAGVKFSSQRCAYAYTLRPRVLPGDYADVPNVGAILGGAPKRLYPYIASGKLFTFPPFGRRGPTASIYSQRFTWRGPLLRLRDFVAGMLTLRTAAVVAHVRRRCILFAMSPHVGQWR